MRITVGLLRRIIREELIREELLREEPAMVNSDEYRAGWDRIFGKKGKGSEKTSESTVEPLEADLKQSTFATHALPVLIWNKLVAWDGVNRVEELAGNRKEALKKFSTEILNALVETGTLLDPKKIENVGQKVDIDRFFEENLVASRPANEEAFVVDFGEEGGKRTLKTMGQQTAFAYHNKLGYKAPTGGYVLDNGKKWAPPSK